MKKFVFVVITATLVNIIYAQTSVYNCYQPTTVTQAQIEATSGSEFQRNCILFSQNQTYNFSGSSDLDVKAATSIKLEPGFVAGPFTGSGNMSLSINETQPIEVVSMNYWDLGAVGKFNKFELGIIPPTEIMSKVNNFLLNQSVPSSEKINPFLEWELKIMAEVTHISTGYKTSVDAFYFRNYERDLNNNVWNDVGTNYPFRVRLALDKLGEWQCVIKIKVGNNWVYENVPFFFNVVSSSNPGYVSKHPNGKNFMRNGEPVYALGQNFAWPQAGYDPATHLGRVSDWITYLNRISGYADQGGKFIRVLTHPSSMDIEWEKLGNYYDRLNYASEIDKLIDLAEQKDLLIHFNMMMHQQLMQVADYCHLEWDFSGWMPNDTCTGGIEPGWYQPYAYRTELGLTNGLQMLVNQTALDYLKQRTRYLISRYGYSTNIYLFELMSESWHVGTEADAHFNCNGGIWECVQESVYEPYRTESGAKAAVYNFHSQMSNFIKNTLDHKQHLVGVDYSGSFDLPNTNPFFPFTQDVNKGWPDYSYSLPNIDVIGLNQYSPVSNKLFVHDDGTGADQDDLEEPYENHIQNLRVNFGKLITFSEFGHGDGKDACSNGTAYKTDVKTGTFCGTAGMNMWHGTYQEPTASYPDLIAAKNFMNNYVAKSVLETDWAHFAAVKEVGSNYFPIELQMYVSANRGKAFGYVKNRTANLETINNGLSPCIDHDDTYVPATSYWTNIQIKGLNSNNDYRIRWFDYFSNGSSLDYVYEDCFNTNYQGNWTIGLPLLSVNQSPIYWFEIEEINCNNLNSNLIERTDQSSIQKASISGNGLTIAPNPFEDFVSITSSISMYSIQVFSSYGRVIKELNLHDEPYIIDIDLKDLASGIYYICINGVSLHKICKL